MMKTGDEISMYPRRRITFTLFIVLLLLYTKTTVLSQTTPVSEFKPIYYDLEPEMEDNWVCKSLNKVCKPDPEILCCEHCICDFTCNNTEKLCCDGSESTMFKNNTISYNFCHSAEFLTVDDEKLTGEKYIFISACEPSESNQTLIELCVATSLMRNSESFFQTLPVTSKSGVSFRNKYCALCNNVTGFIYWDAEVKCKDKQIDGKTFTEVIEQVRNSDDKCNILFNNPISKIGVPRCGFTQTCRKFNGITMESCEPIMSVYTFNEDGITNKQCFTCSRHSFVCGGPGFDPTGFSALLDFNSKDESRNIIPRIYSDTCGENKIYDNIMGTCLEVRCIPPAILSNFSCINMYKTIKQLRYELIVKVLVQNSEKVLIKCSTCVQDLVSNISKIYFSIDLSKGLKMLKCSNKLFLKVSQSEHIPVENRSITFMLIRERFIIEDKHDYISFVSDLIPSIPDEVNVTILDETVTLNFFVENKRYPVSRVPGYGYVTDPDDGQILLNVPEKHLMYNPKCSISSQWNLIHQIKICPHVSINKLLFKHFYRDHYLCFSEVNLCIRRGRYDNTGDSITICYEDYIQFYDLYDAVTQNQTKVLVDEVEGTLSFTCTILSVISLLVALFTYFIFPTLRTLPGLNNMALCVSMLLAHFLYQFGMNQTHLGTGCIALGILTHFTWVLTITWQTICCLHVFRVFVTQTDMTSSRSSRYKSFLFYLLFSFVFSAAVVSSNIIVKMVSSDQKDIGYGGKMCYINDPFMLALTFVLPLGLSVVTNIILILIVSIKFCRMPDLQKNVKNERNNIAIFAKLSTLTGVTWILGFIYGWTNNKILLYIFVILTPLQGVFIMFSFVCNKRVFGLYKSIIFGKKKKNQSSRSTLKSSVYSSDVSLSTIKPD